MNSSARPAPKSTALSWTNTYGEEQVWLLHKRLEPVLHGGTREIWTTAAISNNCNPYLINISIEMLHPTGQAQHSCAQTFEPVNIVFHRVSVRTTHWLPPSHVAASGSSERFGRSLSLSLSLSHSLTHSHSLSTQNVFVSTAKSGPYSCSVMLLQFSMQYSISRASLWSGILAPAPASKWPL